MRSLRMYLCFAWVAALLGAAPLAAQPEPGSDLSVFLLTMGRGDQVWEKFGHNAIWIHDPVRGTDLVYNYGVFDFGSPGYWSRFLRGDWLYQLAVDDIDRTLYQYEYFDRTVTAQELNLTPAQKAELQAFLEWNARPENREYSYDYYKDNCSTRVRDALDRVLGGRLQQETEGEPTGVTYRWHSRRLMADEEVVYTALGAGLGPAADRPLSRWEEMFLPEKVQERVRELRVPGPGGEMVPLVRSEQVLYQARGRSPAPAEPPRWVPVYLLIGAAIGGVLALLGWGAARSSAARLGFSVVAALWALVIGTGGVLLVGLWALTNHSIAYANENLFHFNPLALALVVLAPALAYGARWAARPARWTAIAVAGVSVLGLVLQILPGMDQVNGEVIALILPAHLGLAWAAHYLGRRIEVTGKRTRAAASEPVPLASYL